MTHFIRLINYIIIFFSTNILFTFCNSSKEKSKSESEKLCNQYDNYYYDLKRFIEEKNNQSWNFYEDETTIDKIKSQISDLNKINCPNKKDLKFANNLISLIQNNLLKKNKEREEDRLNGNDVGMEGVQIASLEILFNDDMKPFAQVTLSNKTKKYLKSLKFGVNYCGRNSVTLLCFEYVLVKEDIKPLSTKSFSFALPSVVQGQTDYPKVELLEILRSDGTKVKTWDGVFPFEK